jgi:hypothetical protein
MKGWLGEEKRRRRRRKQERNKLDTEYFPSHHQGISLSTIVTEDFRGVPRFF